MSYFRVNLMKWHFFRISKQKLLSIQNTKHIKQFIIGILIKFLEFELNFKVDEILNWN